MAEVKKEIAAGAAAAEEQKEGVAEQMKAAEGERTKLGESLTALEGHLASELQGLDGRVKNRERTAKAAAAKTIADVRKEITAQAASASRREEAEAKERRELAERLDRAETSLGELPALERRIKKTEQAAQRMTAAALDKKIATKVGAAENRAKKREETTRKRISELADSLPGSGSRGGSPASRGSSADRGIADAGGGELPEEGVDINKVTFEQFCALGLTKAQASRMIATRDVREGFESIDDIGSLRWLPRRTRWALVRKLKARA